MFANETNEKNRILATFVISPYVSDDPSKWRQKNRLRRRKKIQKLIGMSESEIEQYIFEELGGYIERDRIFVRRLSATEYHVVIISPDNVLLESEMRARLRKAALSHYSNREYANESDYGDVLLDSYLQTTIA